MKKIYISLLLGLSLFLPPAVHGSNIQIDSSSPFLYPAYSKRISMNFQDALLVDVLKIFSEQSNLNLVTSDSLANKKVTVYLDNVPVEQALAQILRANGLTYELQPDSEIYIVKPISKPTKELQTRVYYLKYATVSKSKLKKTLSIKAGGNTIDDSTDSPGGSGSGQTSPGINGAVAAILTSDGKLVEDPRTNSIIITDIASNFPNIELAIARLDVPIPQILIEVEMLEITKETADKVGIKIGDTPLAFNGGTRQVVYPWDQNRLLNKGYSFATPEYTTGLVDASGLTATLNFLKTQSDTKNLARPKILTLNNETAQIKITTQEAIGVKTSTTSTSSSSANTTQEAERYETGVSLTVTPQADLSTDEITMAIIPEVIIARTGATFDNQTFLDPEKRGTQSLLRIKSGETIVIGGLMRTDASNTVTKVPFFGDIPLLGMAFRHKDASNTERELIVFITPHIVKDTLSKNTPAVAPKEMVREQDAPVERMKNIDQALETAEQEKL